MNPDDIRDGIPLLVAVALGLMCGIILISSLVDSISVDDKTSEYRKHMIRNDVAGWVINEDGEAVFILKGKQ